MRVPATGISGRTHMFPATAERCDKPERKASLKVIDPGGDAAGFLARSRPAATRGLFAAQLVGAVERWGLPGRIRFSQQGWAGRAGVDSRGPWRLGGEAVVTGW
ncbi:hypothetical protein GCM10022254_17820 [Actinomadura meridiana]|uniref:Uncharacterized protein n=1 Tax=Actinomadura meridiana TaxID=559626 RepID=A0ABP8BW54_9ACTN